MTESEARLLSHLRPDRDPVRPMWAGASVTYTDDCRNPVAFARRVGVTVLVGVPKLYHTLWRRITENMEGNKVRRLLYRYLPKVLGRFLKEKLLGRRFRFFVSGGAPLAAEVGAELRWLGLGMIEGYGEVVVWGPNVMFW